MIRSYLVISAVMSAAADSSGGELSESETSLAQLRWALHNLSEILRFAQNDIRDDLR